MKKNALNRSHSVKNIKTQIKSLSLVNHILYWPDNTLVLTIIRIKKKAEMMKSRVPRTDTYISNLIAKLKPKVEY